MLRELIGIRTVRDQERERARERETDRCGAHMHLKTSLISIVRQTDREGKL